MTPDPLPLLLEVRGSKNQSNIVPVLYSYSDSVVINTTDSVLAADADVKSGKFEILEIV